MSARLLVTRPQPQADAWTAALRSAGFDAQPLPLIAIGPPADEAAVAVAWRDLARHTAVLFVSPAAVQGFFRLRPADGSAPGAEEGHAEQRQAGAGVGDGTARDAPDAPDAAIPVKAGDTGDRLLPWPATCHAAAPGPGTGRELLGLGLPAEQLVMPAADAEQFDSESLWPQLSPLFPADGRARSLLIVGGGDADQPVRGRTWLAERLRERGASVELLGAYRRGPAPMTVPALNLLRGAAADPAGHAWLLSSSESIDHLLAALAQSGLPAPGPAWAAWCTHPRIADRARAAGFGRVALSRPELADVIAALADRPVPPPAEAGRTGPPPTIPGTVSETPSNASGSPVPAAPPLPPAGPSAPAAASPAGGAPTSSAQPFAAPAAHTLPAAPAPVSRLTWVVAAVLLAACAASGWTAWQASQRVQALEQELVRRQQASQDQAAEARMMAKQAQDLARETAARAALVEARVAEVSVQRSQLDDLVQSLSRSREESLVVDLEAGLRVAQQQAALTASAEPLVAALRTADERLARAQQPRLDGVRRALARDLDRVRAVALADAASLVIKLDEAMRLIDEVPLAGDRPAPAEPPVRSRSRQRAAAAAAAATASPASPADASAVAPAFDAPWLQIAQSAWQRTWDAVLTETRNLIRVRQVAHPEALMLTPEQRYFVRENLKLRLLNARMALLSRQYATAQADLRSVLEALPRHADMGTRKAAVLRELLADVATRSVRAEVPRPDETLAALAAAAAGR